MVNFVPAVAYPFCLALPAAFTQPGDHLLAEHCTTHGRIAVVAVPDPAGDERLWRVEDAGVVAVLEAAAEGDGEDGEGQPTVQVLRKEGHDH